MTSQKAFHKYPNNFFVKIILKVNNIFSNIYVKINTIKHFFKTFVFRTKKYSLQYICGRKRSLRRDGRNDTIVF